MVTRLPGSSLICPTVICSAFGMVSQCCHDKKPHSSPFRTRERQSSQSEGQRSKVKVPARAEPVCVVPGAPAAAFFFTRPCPVCALCSPDKDARLEPPQRAHPDPNLTAPARHCRLVGLPREITWGGAREDPKCTLPQLRNDSWQLSSDLRMHAMVSVYSWVHACVRTHTCTVKKN